MLLDLLELASNTALAHDPETLARLTKLQGKTMTLHLKTLGQSLSVTPHIEGLEFSHAIPEKVDVTLSVTIGAMIKISRDGLDNAELESGELEIVGDPIVGQRFAQVMAGLDIDWQGLLAERIGESPARAVSLAAVQAKSFADESRTKFKTLVNTLIKEDLQLVADKDSVENFLDGVDTVRADTDRLMARLTRIQSKV